MNKTAKQCRKPTLSVENWLIYSIKNCTPQQPIHSLRLLSIILLMSTKNAFLFTFCNFVMLLFPILLIFYFCSQEKLSIRHTNEPNQKPLTIKRLKVITEIYSFRGKHANKQVRKRTYKRHFTFIFASIFFAKSKIYSYRNGFGAGKTIHIHYTCIYLTVVDFSLSIQQTTNITDF